MVYSSRDIEQSILELVILGHFLPFYPPPTTPQKSKVWKTKKFAGDIIILHMCTINDNHMMHGSWDIERDRQNFLSFLTIFCPFTPPNNPKNENFRKMKKASEDIIILHMCTKYHGHMLYCSWDMTCDRCNCYFSFWAIFCPFTPLTAWKIKILKKWKKWLEISSFYASIPKIMMISYTIPQIWCVRDVIIFHFGPFFALLCP